MKTNDKYTLDTTGNPVAEPDLMKWAKWYEQRDVRRVADERFDAAGIEMRVSTVFLGIDHSFGDGPPVLWETMIFGGPLDQEQDRCSATASRPKRCTLGCSPAPFTSNQLSI